MILWDSIIPAELTGYVRAALADLEINKFTLSRFLPNRPVNDLLYRFDKGGRGLAEAATFRVFDAESPFGSRQGITRITGELPPISRKIRLSEYDQLRLRNANQEIRDSVFNDAVKMVTSIAARMEMARGEAMRTGKVALNENGVKATIDFGRKAGHTISSIATAWSDHAASDPVANLTTWVQTFLDNTGVIPEKILLSRQIMAHLAQNLTLRNQAGSLAGVPTILPASVINALLDTYSLPQVEVYDAQVSVAGSATRVIDPNWIVMVNTSNGELGSTLYGTTAEALEPGYNVVGGEAGVVAGAYKDEDPVAIYTKAAAIALPVLANPDLTFGVKVL
jgi:hypothetical protein